METHISIIKKLKAIVNDEPKSIRSCVAREALEYGDNPKAFFNDLAQHGCICGMVSSLIFYCDTHAFFDTHYNEIEEIRVEAEEANGGPFNVTGDLKNFMSWLAFEQVARNMMYELAIN